MSGFLNRSKNPILPLLFYKFKPVFSIEFKKRRQSVTSLKVRLPWNRLFPPTVQDVCWCCLLNIPDTMPPGGPQVNFACSHRLWCRFHRWVTPISAHIYTTLRQLCQEIFVKNIYFCLFGKWKICVIRQGRFKKPKNTIFCGIFYIKKQGVDNTRNYRIT